jgi:hypothetical protein
LQPYAKIILTDLTYLEESEGVLRVVKDSVMLHTVKERRANWMVHILRRCCLLKHVIDGNVEGTVEVTARPGRRHKQLLDALRKGEDTGNRKKKH